MTATMCLLAYGAVMVYSASSATSLLQGSGDGAGYLIKFVLYGGVGLVAMSVARAGRRRQSAGLDGAAAGGLVRLVLAVHVPHLGVASTALAAGSARARCSSSPPSCSRLRWHCTRPRSWQGDRSACTTCASWPGRCCSWSARPCLLVVTQPDLGHGDGDRVHDRRPARRGGHTAAQPGDHRGRAFGAIVLYAIAKPYARARLTSFIDPWAHASGSGFQAVQGQIAIGSGGLFGVGPGQSVQKIFYLPEAPTDFILAVIAEELGVIGVCALLFLYGLIAYAGLRAAKAARSLHSALIAVGMTSLIVSQALLNVFAVLGLAPLTGVPLPFVSYGSSSLIVTLAAMGLC